MLGRLAKTLTSVFSTKPADPANPALTAILSSRQEPRVYVQIGAGAGDQDGRAGYRDGFSELVKALPAAEIAKIILVEPNPDNMPGLRYCWKDHPEAEIHQLGIVTKDRSGHDLAFYKAAADAPNFQVASADPNHVLKHYPDIGIDDLIVSSIATMDLASFLAKTAGDARVELLCLDIEGLDADILLDTDLSCLNVNLLSLEHLHLGDRKDAVVAHLEMCGYRKIGLGVDHNGFDWLYQRQ